MGVDRLVGVNGRVRTWSAARDSDGSLTEGSGGSPRCVSPRPVWLTWYAGVGVEEAGLWEGRSKAPCVVVPSSQRVTCARRGSAF